MILRVLFVIAAAAAAATLASAQEVIEVRTPGLVPYRIVANGIPEPLTATPGDPERGKRIVTNAANSTCLICHTMPLPELPDHGNLAPDLAGVGDRYTAAELRLRLVNPKVLSPDTMMPAYYRLEGLTRVQQQYQGKTIYSAQDVEDAIAYLLTIKK